MDYEEGKKLDKIIELLEVLVSKSENNTFSGEDEEINEFPEEEAPVDEFPEQEKDTKNPLLK